MNGLAQFTRVALLAALLAAPAFAEQPLPPEIAAYYRDAAVVYALSSSLERARLVDPTADSPRLNLIAKLSSRLESDVQLVNPWIEDSMEDRFALSPTLGTSSVNTESRAAWPSRLGVSGPCFVIGHRDIDHSFAQLAVSLECFSAEWSGSQALRAKYDEADPPLEAPTQKELRNALEGSTFRIIHYWAHTADSWVRVDTATLLLE